MAGPASSPRQVDFSELAGLVGSELGVSSWHAITQERIDAFAALTGDEQWIHTDPERAASGPFGTTIAHGYLTLTLSTAVVFEVAEFTGVASALNYGVDKVRFKAPVPSGSRVRGHVGVASVRRRGRHFTELVLDLRFELEGSDVVPCTAQVTTLLSPAPA
ncbi:MAG: MaoC family dehydratase [Solirubrobacteraceae bacterium]|nr:MaoC family dehydratase [Solirubrobacteraceae bacterium]